VENRAIFVEKPVEKPVENQATLWNSKTQIHSLWKTSSFYPQVFHRHQMDQNFTL
jgi:hypothetical protein